MNNTSPQQTNNHSPQNPKISNKTEKISQIEKSTSEKKFPRHKNWKYKHHQTKFKKRINQKFKKTIKIRSKKQSKLFQIFSLSKHFKFEKQTSMKVGWKSRTIHTAIQQTIQSESKFKFFRHNKKSKFKFQGERFEIQGEKKISRTKEQSKSRNSRPARSPKQSAQTQDEPFIAKSNITMNRPSTFLHIRNEQPRTTRTKDTSQQGHPAQWHPATESLPQ